MIVVAITASSVDIMGKLLRSGLADRTNEEGYVLTLLDRHSILHPSAFIKDRGVEDFHTECRSDCACPTGAAVIHHRYRWDRQWWQRALVSRMALQNCHGL